MEKVIWIFWAQGWRNAPTIAKAARNSWKHLNSDWQVRPLDRDSDEYEGVKESPPLLKLSKAPFKKGAQVELFVKPYLK